MITVLRGGFRLHAGGPGSLALRRVGHVVPPLSVAADAVRRAGPREILAHLSHRVVHPPDVRVVLVLVAEVRLREGLHRGRARAAVAVAPEVHQAAEGGDGLRAEEIVLDGGGSRQRLVRDARRHPREEVLHRVRGRVRAGQAQEEALQEHEEIFHVHDRRRAVRRGDLRAAARRATGRTGDARGPAELAPAGECVEAGITRRRRELAAEERAVAADPAARDVRVDRGGRIIAERVQDLRDGGELLADLAATAEAALVAAGDDRCERGVAPRRGVVRDGELGAVPGEQVEVRRRRRRDRGAALHAAAFAGRAVVAVSLIVGDEQDDVRTRRDRRRRT